MKRVEMVGCMGAGKSTLHRAFLQAAGPRVRTAASEKWDCILRHTATGSRFDAAVLRVVGASRRVRRLVLADRLVWQVFETAPGFLQRNEDLLRLVMYRREDAAGVGMLRELQRVHKFLRELNEVALFERYGCDGIVVQDESLLQRGLGLALGQPDPIAFIDRYCGLVPAPHAAIVVESDEATVMRRLRQRKDAGDHVSNAPVATALARRVAERMEERGTRVIVVRGDADPVVVGGELVGRLA